jgi:hypothetical protein
VDVFVSDTGVDIDLRGMDMVLCLARHLHLGIGDIVRAQVAPVRGLRDEIGWRFGGAAWPGALTTGWYTVRGLKGRRQLWCVYRDPEVLVIDTTLPKPSRVVLQHPDRHDLAWYIGERLA